MFIFFKSTIRSSNFTCNFWRNWNSVRKVTEDSMLYTETYISYHTVLEFSSRAIMNCWYVVLFLHDMKGCTINMIYHLRWYICVTDIHAFQVSYKKPSIFSNPSCSQPSAWIINVQGYTWLSCVYWRSNLKYLCLHKYSYTLN